MTKVESFEEFISRSIQEAKFDVDVKFCVENKLNFYNHEIDFNSVSLFSENANKAAFDFVFKNK